MIITNRMHPSDVPEILGIHDKLDFAWRDPVYGLGTIVCRDQESDKMIGAGFLRPIVEAVMYLDPDASKRDKAVALYSMMGQAISDAKATGLGDIYAWVKQPNFVRVLKNHYLYEEEVGTSLVLKL